MDVDVVETVAGLRWTLDHSIEIPSEISDPDFLHSLVECLSTASLIAKRALRLTSSLGWLSDAEPGEGDPVSEKRWLGFLLNELADVLAEDRRRQRHDNDLEIQTYLDRIYDMLMMCSDIVRRIRAGQTARPRREVAYSDHLGMQRRRAAEQEDDASEGISVAIYIDGANDKALGHVFAATDHLVHVLGYSSPNNEIIESGSIFRRYWAAIRRGLSSREARANFVRAGRALELLALDGYQAQVDQQVAAAVSDLVDSLKDVQTACVRVGSILLVKYASVGESMVLVRNLSQIEIRAMEKFPEIQRNPEKAFEALSLAVTQLESAEDGQLP